MSEPMEFHGVECSCGWTGDTISEFEEHLEVDHE